MGRSKKKEDSGSGSSNGLPTRVGIVSEVLSNSPTGGGKLSERELEVRGEALSLIQEACRRIGMGIDDYLMAIKEGLSAGKRVEKLYDGEIKEEIEPDHGMRLKAAAMGLEVEGYLRGKVGGEVVNNYFDVKALVQAYRSVK